MPAVPNLHALAAMLLTLVALGMFSRERVPLELSSLVLLTVLSVGFTIFPFGDFRPEAFFSGFGHDALVAVCALMVLGQALVYTGALEPLGRSLGRLWKRSPSLSFAATLLVAAVLSAFINNTPIVVLLLPILVSVCLGTSTPPTRVLMPMGFATLVGGTATTIGTSTNLLVVSVASDLGLAPIGMFDFLLPASIAGSIALLYLWLIAPRLLPSRDIELADASPRLFEARLQIGEGSPMEGKTLAEAVAATGGDLRVARIRRGENLLLPLPDVVVRVGDRFHVTDNPARLKSFEEALGATLFSADHRVDADHPLSAENQMLAEVAVVRGSSLDHTSLRFTRFLSKYQLIVLALHRAGVDMWDSRNRIQDVTLQPGDVLLVQGPSEQIGSLKRSTEFLVLDANVELPKTAKASTALTICLGVVLLAATGVLSISVSAVAGVALMILTRCIGGDTAFRAINPSVFFVIVASLALGRALTETGATDYLTGIFVFATQGVSPSIVLGALMLMMAILTNMVSNNAAAVIGTPIAISIAQRLALPPEPFVLAVLFGANMSYATPMAYQTNLLIMNTGNYKFSEFAKVGVPLIGIMLITLTVTLSRMYFP